MWFQCDTVFHQCPLSIAIARGDCLSFQIIMPHIRDWNDKRFSLCVPTVAKKDANKNSIIALFAVEQILNATSNPTSAPLSNLIEIARKMIQHGAKINLEELQIDF